MPLWELPPEILRLIATQLEPEKDISSLMRTSARNYHILLPFLYKHNVDFFSGSALMWCVDHDYEAGARLLLEFGADTKEQERIFYSSSQFLPVWTVGPLHFAQSETMAKVLLDHGVKVNDSPCQWGTPLHVAAERGDTSLAKFLLENGANVNEPNSRVATPLHIAADQGDLDMATLLLDYGAQIDSCDTSARWETCNYYGAPLHFAVLKKGDAGFPMTKLLLERGADVAATDCGDVWVGGDLSATPLHIAAETCNLSTAKLLLDYGAPVNIRDKMGITPLYRAADRSDSDMAKLLLDHGAQVNAQLGEENFKNPLHKAVSYGVLATVELIIGHGAQVNEQDSKGRNCLHLAMKAYNVAMVKPLLDNGVPVNAQDETGRTPLDYATNLQEIIRKYPSQYAALQGVDLPNLLISYGAVVGVQGATVI